MKQPSLYSRIFNVLRFEYERCTDSLEISEGRRIAVRPNHLVAASAY